MDRNNKIIAINTIVMYARLIITTIIGLLTSRFVLQALGASDFGLYSVVGGIITMLGVINTAMHTTTRRYINVEMGKPDGNMNRIFNISRLLHYGFAAFIFLLAETVGMFYIYNYLNVVPEKLNDAIFVFHVSTIVAAISIINVPYQALLQAFEQFTQVAIIDIISSFSKLVFVVWLLYAEGNTLRIYAIGISCLTLLSLLLYNIACMKQWKNIVKYKFYKEPSTYKEILFFNNYVALGATSFLSRTQGSNILVNFFFGTIANAAFSIGYTIENYCIMFVSNIGSAAGPQITQNYADNNERSFMLTTILNKFSTYLMLLIVTPLFLEMDFILNLWLKEVPVGTTLICQLTLLSALCRRVFGGLDTLVQASGQIKWFQIVGSVIEISPIPITYMLYKLGAPAHTIIVVFIFATILGTIITYSMMKYFLKFDILRYARQVLLPISRVILPLIIYALFYILFVKDVFLWPMFGLILNLFVVISVIMLFGLNKREKELIDNIVVRKLFKK